MGLRSGTETEPPELPCFNLVVGLGLEESRCSIWIEIRPPFRGCRIDPFVDVCLYSVHTYFITFLPTWRDSEHVLRETSHTFAVEDMIWLYDHIVYRVWNWQLICILLLSSARVQLEYQSSIRISR